jgi:1-deoxy-D-xylulose 5-phosphate reductoisomerase
MMQPAMVSVPAERIAEAAAALVTAGPVLVVADVAAVGRLAPRWARDFAAAGRVRVGGDAAAIAAEIRSLDATVVAVVGSADMRATVAPVAAAAGLPCVCGMEDAVAAPPHGGQSSVQAPSPSGRGLG